MAKVIYFAGNGGQRRKDKARSGMPADKTVETFSQHNYTRKKREKKDKRNAEWSKHVEKMLCAA